MTESIAAGMPPRRILLATDLTSRTDRALERALQLARAWKAALHIVHAVQTPPVSHDADADPLLQRFTDPKGEALRLLRRDVRPDALGVPCEVHIEEAATPASAILATAERTGCELLVLGETRQHWMSPLVESAVDEIVRRSPSSVLIVRDRVHGPYRHVLVGTDFTDEARQALVAAATVFGDAAITLMHAYSQPYAFLLDGAPEHRERPAQELARLDAHAASAGLPADRAHCVRTVVEAGSPAAVLRRHAMEQGPDLTVIGAHPRGALFDAVIGHSRRIVDAVPGDVLMIRATRPSFTA